MKNLVESIATLKLKKIIDSEKERLKFIKSDYAKMKVQEQIIDLQNEILPIVETETVLLFNEINKYVHKYVKKAIEMDNDAVLVFLPLKDIVDKCTIGQVNPKTQKFGSENIDSIEVFISDMGVGGRKIDVEHLDLID